MDIECPECGHEFDICHDDGHGCTEDEIYQQECPACEKMFVFDVGIIFCYHANKAPCLNDGDHNWKKIHGAPKEYFENKYRCEYCDEEKEIK